MRWFRQLQEKEFTARMTDVRYEFEELGRNEYELSQ